MSDMKPVPESVDIDPPRKEAFLGRWSRIKQEVRAGAVPPGTVEPAADTPILPSLETLSAQGLEADFAPFMQKGVAEATKRAAIQQLFKQPVFNVMDGLDVYIEDFNVFEPLTAAELPGLAHARAILFPETEDEMDKKVATVDSAPPVLGEAENEICIDDLAEETLHGRG